MAQAHRGGGGAPEGGSPLGHGSAAAGRRWHNDCARAWGAVGLGLGPVAAPRSLETGDDGVPWVELETGNGVGRG